MKESGSVHLKTMYIKRSTLFSVFTRIQPFDWVCKWLGKIWLPEVVLQKFIYARQDMSCILRRQKIIMGS